MKKFFKENSNIIIAVLFLFVMVILIDNIVGKSILDHSYYNSYELQAEAWLKGKTYLDGNYIYLELAIYKGNYYVSFPPLPSLILLPFVYIFGSRVPTNLICFLVFAFELVIIYKILKRYKTKELFAILLALGFTVGTNLTSLVIDSGVWFVAQIFNNMLCILAIDAFLKDKKRNVYLFLALAVGCRPFSAIYMVMFFIYYVLKDKDKSIIKRIINNITPVIPAMCVAIAYMVYNYIRFGNILEFGHNYLPEFTRAEHGQFSLYYLFNNLKKFFFNGIMINKKLKLSFDIPFCFIIANPIIMVYYYRIIKNYFKKEKAGLLRIMIFISIGINILCICLHKTLGAWQFGARYSCDFLPFILLALLSYKGIKGQTIKLDKFEIVSIIFGIILNIFGAIMMYTHTMV